MHRCVAILAVITCFFWKLSLPVEAITIDTVYVGDLSNPVDPADGDAETPGVQNFGSVPYAYRLGAYDVTFSQYAAFLNAKDPAGGNTLGLFNSGMSDAALGGITFNAGSANGSKYSVIAGRGNRPVNYVSWFSAARFANWLQNGQGNGNTENGAYLLTGNTPTPSNAASIVRQSAATVFIPTENEWYKAAYFNPATNSYFLFPTSSNNSPTAGPPTAAANTANFQNAVGSSTDVGAYSGTKSPYGAFDMAGNVFQWNEQLFDGGDRGLRGGMFTTSLDSLKSSFRSSFDPQVPFLWGFRVATIPGPQFPGDADYNNVVNFVDLGTVLNNYDQPSFFASGDFNNSGTVDFIDLGILLNNYDQTGPVLAPSLPVPEPGSLALAAFAIALLAGHCRRMLVARPF